jgi:hypothetical protein
VCVCVCVCVCVYVLSRYTCMHTYVCVRARARAHYAPTTALAILSNLCHLARRHPPSVCVCRHMSVYVCRHMSVYVYKHCCLCMQTSACAHTFLLSHSRSPSFRVSPQPPPSPFSLPGKLINIIFRLITDGSQVVPPEAGVSNRKENTFYSKRTHST